jgi:hypothetical protein
MNKELKYYIENRDDPNVLLIIKEGNYEYVIYCESYFRHTCIGTLWHVGDLMEITLLEVLAMSELLHESIDFVHSCDTCGYSLTCNEFRLAERGQNILNELRSIIRGDESVCIKS